MRLQTWPKKPDAANPAIAARLNCRRYWRGVGEPERWARMIMGRSITGLLAVVAAASMCGCRSPQNPSDEVRHASYIRCQSLFTGNNEAAKRWTYIVFSGGAQFTI